MDINKLREEKQKLEANIHKEIAKLLEVFRESTGLSPENIYVEMVETTTMGEKEPKYIVGKVRTTIRL